MPAPHNAFKAALTKSQRQVGLWLALADPYAAELAGHVGFDWLVIDGEHAPNDLRSMLAQLQAIGNTVSHPVVRLPTDAAWMIKQVLDIGAQTILVPVVESADQARAIVAATRYAPHGVRGIGAALARASQFNGITDYIDTASEQICVLVQIETRAGAAALDEILAVEGVDGVFVGPADLAADMGLPGKPGHGDVVAVIKDILKRIIASGKPSGILTSDASLLEEYFNLGAAFVAVGSDIGVLTTGLRALRTRFPSN